MKLDFDNMPESDLIINYIADRFAKGRYTLSCVIGEPGGGKSNVCLRLAQLISLKIYGEDRITKDCIIDSNLKMARFALNATEGDIGVIEESEILFPSRRSMSGANLDAGHILNTCRKKKIILFSNSPIYKAIDLGVRAHVKLVVEALNISIRRRIVIYKMLKTTTHPMTGKDYYKRFTRDGIDIHRGFCRFVNKELFEAYEEDKDKFMQRRYQQAVVRAMKAEEKIEGEMGLHNKPSFKKELTKLEAEVFRRIILNSEKQVDVARDKGISTARVSKICANVKKKLVFLEDKP